MRGSCQAFGRVSGACNTTSPSLCVADSSPDLHFLNSSPEGDCIRNIEGIPTNLPSPISPYPTMLVSYCHKMNTNLVTYNKEICFFKFIICLAMPWNLQLCHVIFQHSLRYVGYNSLTRIEFQPLHWEWVLATGPSESPNNKMYYRAKSEVRSLKWLSLGWNQGVGKATSSSKALGGKCTFLPFPALRGHPHSLAPAPCIFKATILPNETSFLLLHRFGLWFFCMLLLTMSLVVTLGSPDNQAESMLRSTDEQL